MPHMKRLALNATHEKIGLECHTFEKSDFECHTFEKMALNATHLKRLASNATHLKSLQRLALCLGGPCHEGSHRRGRDYQSRSLDRRSLLPSAGAR